MRRTYPILISALFLCACQPRAAETAASKPPPATVQAPAAAPAPELPPKPVVDVAFLAGLWNPKGVSCSAATDDFYTFSRKGRFSSPALEEGKYRLKGDTIVLWPEEPVTGEVIRKETLPIQRTEDGRLVLDGRVYRKCVQYTRCIDRDLPLSECNPG